MEINEKKTTNLFTPGSTTTAAAVQGELLSTKEGLSGMRGAARLAEAAAVLKLGVREHGGLKRQEGYDTQGQDQRRADQVAATVYF